MDQTHPGWQDLLDWLALHGMDTSPATISVQARASFGAGYGLFAVKDINQETLLFSIPSSALLNIATLSPLYPNAQHQLTAIQLMSLHLFLHRPHSVQSSIDPVFGPYISTLPSEFSSHPLTWLCSKELSNPGLALLSNLPPSITSGLRDVANRFHADWSTVKQYIQSEVSHPKHRLLRSDPTQCEEDFLWAWLNVNTRCLYHRLTQPPSDKNNVTMCPIIDFANHTPGSNHMLPRPSNNALELRGRDFAIVSPSSSTTKQDDELFLTYGPHSNHILFVEYGFVNEVSPQVLSDGDVVGEIDIGTSMIQLFKTRGELGDWMKDILQNEGYWGDWTLHSHPSPAHPSFRLITALRLYHLFPTSETKVPSDGELTLNFWKATILGTAEMVSKENEESWKECLLHICQILESDASSAITTLAGQEISGGPVWFTWARQNIRMLWEEQLLVSSMVAKSILQHEEF